MCDKKTYGTVLGHNSSNARQKSMHWYPLTACIFLFLNAATFRGINGQTHGANVKKSQ